MIMSVVQLYFNIAEANQAVTSVMQSCQFKRTINECTVAFPNHIQRRLYVCRLVIHVLNVRNPAPDILHISVGDIWLRLTQNHCQIWDAQLVSLVPQATKNPRLVWWVFAADICGTPNQVYYITL